MLFEACSASKPSAAQLPPSPGRSSAPSAPVPTSSPPAPTTATASGAPLSPFEADPAVKALRAWAAEAAKTINTGHYDSAALNALMVPSLAKKMKFLAGGEVGFYYPGPVPFTPVRITVRSSRERDVAICFLGSGYSQNPKTHEPAQKRVVLPTLAGATLVRGKWLVSKFGQSSFSCAGVRIPEPSWGD
jgi:hypothetical protein